MSRFFHLLAAAGLLFLFALPAAAQASPSASAQNAEALTAAYNQAVQTKDWPVALAAAQQLVSLKATSQNLTFLGTAQLYSGSSDAALATYDRAIATAEQEKPADGQALVIWKDGLSRIYIGRGNALLKLKRNAEAVDNYNRSAEFSSNPGLAYYNVCAVLYNMGHTKDSAAACRKCVRADPSRANAWFILGSDLFADLPVTAQGKVQASPETREALEKYLELAPDGPHAADTKAMLDMIAK
jgi:tetratricopeptide (TPR) repeat protein